MASARQEQNMLRVSAAVLIEDTSFVVWHSQPFRNRCRRSAMAVMDGVTLRFHCAGLEFIDRGINQGLAAPAYSRERVGPFPSSNLLPLATDFTTPSRASLQSTPFYPASAFHPDLRFSYRPGATLDPTWLGTFAGPPGSYSRALGLYRPSRPKPPTPFSAT